MTRRVSSPPKILVYWLMQTEADVPADDAWLADEEAAVLAGLRFPKRRTAWRLGRWTAKQALSACLADEPALSSIAIRAAADGAPEAFREGAPAPFTLSISHRDGLAFCAVAGAGVAMGCDLEKIEPRSTAFVADYFTPEEQRLVAARPRAERDGWVNLLWSAKESALKAVRQGLRVDTRRVAVRLPASEAAGWRPMTVAYADDGQTFEGWYHLGDTLVRTLVAHPPPRPPIALRPGGRTGRLQT